MKNLTLSNISSIYTSLRRRYYDMWDLRRVSYELVKIIIKNKIPSKRIYAAIVTQYIPERLLVYDRGLYFDLNKNLRDKVKENILLEIKENNIRYSFFIRIFRYITNKKY